MLLRGFLFPDGHLIFVVIFDMAIHSNRFKAEDRTHQIFGVNGILSVLKNNKYLIRTIEILENSSVTKNVEIKELLKNFSSQINYFNRDAFNKKYENKRTQGIVVTFSGSITKTLPLFKEIEGNYCLLIVDNVTDPQNFGQIIRTSECAGVDGIIIPERNSIGITDTVLQVSQGAFCSMPIYSVTNLNQTISQLKEDDFWTIAVENGIDAKSWDQIDYNGKIAIIIGSEGQGIKPLVLKSCDFQATIPMQGNSSSLNVSAATAVVLFERLRQII